MSTRPSVSPVEERHIDYILEEEFCVDPDFLGRFLALAHWQPVERRDGRSVTPPPDPVQEHRCRAVRSVTTSDGESDVLVTYVAGAAMPVALLIEDKLRAGFQEAQAERYRERGEAGRGLEWSEYYTVLVAHEKYTSDPGDFDGTVTLQSLQEHFAARSDPRSSFRARVIGEAIAKFERSGVQQVDDDLTKFRARYAAEFDRVFAVDVWWREPIRQAWWDDTWFDFRRRNWPKDVRVRHQVRTGRMQLILPTRDDTLLGSVLARTESETGTGQHRPVLLPVGKHKLAVTLPVQPLSHFGEDSAISGDFFDAVEWLARFYAAISPMLPEELRSKQW